MPIPAADYNAPGMSRLRVLEEPLHETFTATKAKLLSMGHSRDMSAI